MAFLQPFLNSFLQRDQGPVSSNTMSFVMIYSPLSEKMFLFREAQTPTWLLLFQQNLDLGAAS